MNSARMSDMPAKPETLAWLIAKHAHTAADAKAILASSRVPLAFGALVGQCSDTAHVLAAAGFGRGSRIGIALPNGPEMAVAMLAVMSCATCVPLNLAGEEESLRYLFRRLRLQTVIVPEGESGGIQRVANELGLPTLLLASSVDDPAGIFTLRGETSGRAMPISASGPEDIALVLHTSGTTGKPKAVPLTQRNQYQATLSRA